MSDTILCKCTLCDHMYYGLKKKVGKKQLCKKCFKWMIPDDCLDFCNNLKKCKEVMC